MATTANDRQVGGEHYRNTEVTCPHCGGKLQHWDIFGLWEGLLYAATKYLWRWKQKDGVQGLEKAVHYIEKRIEVARRTQTVGETLDSAAR